MARDDVNDICPSVTLSTLLQARTGFSARGIMCRAFCLFEKVFFFSTFIATYNTEII